MIRSLSSFSFARNLVLILSLVFYLGAWGNEKPEDIQAQTLLASCKKATTESMKICDTEEDSGLRQATQMGSQLAAQMGMQAGANAGAGVQGSCGGLGKVLTFTNGALLAYNAACTTKYMDCSKVCKEGDEYITHQIVNLRGNVPIVSELEQQRLELRQYRSQCNNLSRSLEMAATNLMGLMGSIAEASVCKNKAQNPMEEWCRQNVGSPLCGDNGSGPVADCSNPQFAASNQVCICQANPFDPRCGGSYSSNTGPSLGSNGDGGGAGAGADGSLGLFDGGAGGGIGGDAAGVKGNNNALAPNGKGSSGGVSGRAGDTGGGGAGGGKAGAGGGGFNTKIIGGYGGGGRGGGGGFFGGGSASSGGGGGGSAGARSNVDLSKFLPGGINDPKRGLAGIIGPDGMTGPNSDLWKKVRVRYSEKSVEMLP